MPDLMQLLENATDEWTADAVAEHGFEHQPGDAALFNFDSDDHSRYRVVQFIDIISPTDAPHVTGLVAEYVVEETDMPATYEITGHVDTAQPTPANLNRTLDSSKREHLYALTRTDDETFTISN